MKDFKSNPKMQCFKEGGSVKYESRKQHKEEVSADVAQDKKIVKKAFKMHDKQEHKGEHTDLSSLKKGGRAKKAVGTVSKYKTGGSISNVYEAKKSAADKDNIEKVKNIKPAKLCGGKSVKKMASGSLTGALLAGAAPAAGAGTAGLLAKRELEKKAIRDKYLGAQQQAQLASQQAQATAAQPLNAAASAAAPAQDVMGSPTGVATQKRGGKVKGKC